MRQIIQTHRQLTPILQAARKNAGITQEGMAIRLNTSQATQSRLELNPASMRVDHLLTMLNQLGLELIVQDKQDAQSTRTVREPSSW
jgi:HTH-type transcriptional regulator / antitoxin HipB